MPDKWDLPPDIPPQCYPIWGDESPELCEEIRKHYERRCEEARRQWPQQRVELVQDRLKFLDACQNTPGPERGRRLRNWPDRYQRLHDCVYLMWCPSLRVYKVGHTESLWRRTNEHRRNLDPHIEHLVSYYTPISRRLLEWFLIRHFQHFRVQSDLSEELFDLPQKEVDGFNDTTAVIESHLLAVENLRLKALLAKFEAEARSGIA
jgi:hypothetical protein